MFRTLFRKKIELPHHDENWQVYFSRINNQKALVIFDLNVVNVAPLKILPIVFYLIVPFELASEEGLPTVGSFKLINELEDKIAEIKDKFASNIMHVATISMNSERLQMYYCNRIFDTKEFLQQIDKSFGKHLTYQIDHREDSKWDDFFNLAHPLPFQLEMIKNKNVLRQLAEAGDNLSARRAVFHYIKFEKDQDVIDFLEFAEANAFDLKSQQKRDNSWEICISRLDYISYEKIDDLCLPISENARIHNGNYERWESDIVSS